MSDLETQVYKIIDKALTHLSQEKSGAINFDIYSAEGQEALKIIQDYNLISFRSDNIPISIADITIKGQKVIDVGGIIKYLNSLNNKLIQKEKKEELEIEILNSQIELIKNQLKDYSQNKWIARIALFISILLAIIEFIKLLNHNS